MTSPEIQRRSPYQGLIPYSEADAPFFFGREKETRLIIANLFGSPLTLLYGASGVGKSSVLRAGVAHQLREREDLLVVVFNSWQGNPLSDLKQAVADWADLADHTAWRKAVTLLPQDRPASLSEFLAICAAQLNRRLMIILDQFEEYFLYHPQDDEFAGEFPRAVTQTGAPVSFMISIREDFYAKLDRFEGRIPALYDNYLRIEHLSREAARVAIEAPIAQYNQVYASTEQQISIEPELVEAVLTQVETGRVILGEAGRGVIESGTTEEEVEAQIETPFLQLVMTRLWEEDTSAQSNRLRLTTLDTLGGAENIVRTHLDAVISKLTQREQEVAASIFHYLVTPSGTKIAYNSSDLAGSAELNEVEVVRVLEKLSHGDVRILRPVDPTLDRPLVPRYEIFHDVLAPAILTWRTGYVQAQERADAERRAEEQQRRADEQARVASRFRRLAMALALVILVALGAVVLAVAQTARARANAFRADNYAKESEQLRQEGRRDKALAQAERKRAEEQARLAVSLKQRGDAAQLVAETERRNAEKQIKIAEQRKTEADRASMVATTAQALAALKSMEAEKEARAARIGYSNLLAVQSRVVTEEFPQRSLLLAVEAVNLPQPGDPPVPAAESALRQALSQTGGRVFSGHNATVNHVAISPNNRWLLSEDQEGVAYLWDLNATDPAAAPHRLQGARNPHAFSQDNRWLATGSAKQEAALSGTTALLWDLSNLAAPPHKLFGQEEPVNSVVISSNSRWLVTGTEHILGYGRPRKITARLWDLTAKDPGAKPILLTGELNLIVGMSPDSHWLITNSSIDGKTVSLWDLTAANPIGKSFVLSGHTGAITHAVTSPDGHWLATSSSSCSFGTDTNVRLWDLTASNPSSTPIVLGAHKEPVGGLVFSPDSKRLVTGGDTTEATNCNADPNSLLWDLTRPTAPPANLGTLGKPVAFMSVEKNELLITQPDESATKLYALEDNSAQQVLDLGGGLVGSSSNHQVLVTLDMKWFQDNKQVVKLMIGGGINFKPPRLWNFNKFESPEFLTLSGHENLVTAAGFSQDNRFVVTGGMDKMVRLWTLTNSSLKAAPLVLRDSVKKYALDPDSRWLTTQGADNTVNVWDLSVSDPTANPIILRGHEKKVSDVAVSPDSRWLATNSADGTVRLWDMSAANPSANARILRDLSFQLVFSPDNRWLATLRTVDKDATIHLWDVSNPSVNPKVWATEVSSAGSIYIGPDNDWLIDFGHQRMWNMGARGLDLKSMDLKSANSLTISHDGDWLVSSVSGTTELRNLHDKNSAATVRNLEEAGSPFVFSPDHRWLFTSRGGKACLWDLKAANPTAAPLILGEVKGMIRLAVFSPDGNWLAVSLNADVALLWNLRDLSSKPFVLKGDSDVNISAMDVSADNRWLVTSSFFEVRMWDLTAANPGAAAVILPTPSYYDEAAFSRYDPKRQWLILLSSGGDNSGAIALWNMQRQELVEQACRVAGRNLSEIEWKGYFPDKPYRKTCPNLPAGK